MPRVLASSAEWKLSARPEPTLRMSAPLRRPQFSHTALGYKSEPARAAWSVLRSGVQLIRHRMSCFCQRHFKPVSSLFTLSDALPPQYVCAF